MASNAFNDILLDHLRDGEDLDDAHARLSLLPAYPRQSGSLNALNREIVVICISAWESYIEGLMRECLTAMRPVGPSMGAWPVHAAQMTGQINSFHTPNAEHIKRLVDGTIGLADLPSAWFWAGETNQQVLSRLTQALHQRHKIAHGAHPLPVIHHQYASDLPAFFRKLGECTDNAVRNHFASVLGILNPWPP